MLNVLVVGSHLNYNLEYYVTSALKDMNVNVKFLGYRQFFSNRTFNITRMVMTRSALFRNTIAYSLFLRQFNKELLTIVDSNAFDLIISLKGEAILPSTLREISKNKIILSLWFPDDPRFFDSLVKHIAPFYDYVFTSSTENSMLNRYKNLNKSVFSLPFACYERVHKRIDCQDKHYDVSFVGSYTPFRGKVIKKLADKGINIAVFGPNWKKVLRSNLVFDSKNGHDMVVIFNQSKICLNMHDPDSAKYSTNMRDFEITGSGGVLLTDRAYGLDKYFNIDSDLLIYDDISSLHSTIQTCLKSESRMLEIGRRGEERAHRDHTYKTRMHAILNVTGLMK